MSLRGQFANWPWQSVSPKPPLRKGKSPKRCQWQKKRGDFEEVPRLAATTVAGNRLARRWAGCHGSAVTEGSPTAPFATPRPQRPPCLKGGWHGEAVTGGFFTAPLVPINASGGVLSVTSDRKYPKSAAKTNGFGFLARAWRGKYRNPFTPRIKPYNPAPCFRTVSGSKSRDALRACAALV